MRGCSGAQTGKAPRSEGSERKRTEKAAQPSPAAPDMSSFGPGTTTTPPPIPRPSDEGGGTRWCKQPKLVPSRSPQASFRAWPERCYPLAGLPRSDERPPWRPVRGTGSRGWVQATQWTGPLSEGEAYKVEQGGSECHLPELPALSEALRDILGWPCLPLARPDPGGGGLEGAGAPSPLMVVRSCMLKLRSLSDKAPCPCTQHRRGTRQ